MTVRPPKVFVDTDKMTIVYSNMISFIPGTVKADLLDSKTEVRLFWLMKILFVIKPRGYSKKHVKTVATGGNMNGILKIP